MSKRILIVGIVLIGTAVILGAFGAHALKEVLTQEKLASYETGVRYQIYHGLALMIIGFNAYKLDLIKAPFIFLLSGVLLFSVSIYLLALQDVLGINLGFLGPVTPVGGVLMIVGWFMLILSVLKTKMVESK